MQSGLKMSAGPSRREVVQAGGAAAAVAPFLGAKAAGAEMDKKAIAPVITIFDHRGCDRITKEYQGRKANTYDDYMLVKVKVSLWSTR